MATVAFFGERGAYSEQAAVKFFGRRARTLPFGFLADVFNAARGSADYGVVPIENSIEGAVTQTYDLLLKTNLHIVGEEVLRISHCLIALPGTRISAVKEVYSHPQALAQCREYIEKMRLRTVPSYDTAGSVKIIREKGLQSAAAIASKDAARIYGMKILASGIETSRHNYTRFFIISRKEAKDGNKTSIVFSFDEDKPGSLYHALDCFSRNGINLNYIQSRPILGKPWRYNFYIDCEGRKDDRKLNRTLKELKEITGYVKVLGSYKKARESIV